MNTEMMMENRVDNINGILNGMDAGFSVMFDRIPKNNVTRDALIMRPFEKGLAAPTIYLNGELMEKTDGELASFLKEMYLHHRMDMPDLTAILARERILDTVLPRLTSAENAARLDSCDRVYEQMLDLLISYYIPVDEFGTPDGSNAATIQITRAILRRTDISVDEIKEAALMNMLDTVDIISMSDMITELTGSPIPGCDDSLPIYVVTNKNRLFGAASILLDKVKDELRDKLGDTYYILPSSIHEILAVPAKNDTDADEFLQMVIQINKEQVAVEDRLVDNVYMVHGREISMAL